MSEVKQVLFVCLGNICRSPIAEAVFLHVVKERGLDHKWTADSAATGPWHIGRMPEKRARNTLQKHSIEYNGRARQLQRDDYNRFDYIFGMDESNMMDINADAPSNCKAKILMLGDFDPEGDTIIRDPYYDSGSEGFEKCFVQCLRCCNAFLDKH
ncbi:hypothetical protein PPYR_02936 [Photinus pyralis]|uniref:Low molecular weight phosphotyrosine protein phosphatase n=1 Tax=Photinus pyralis TaxID=7054 RepID=A0A1Y1LRE4_PHOPY|nr:low molecular weight phosphotyrosine protein phosphatase-like [Photinus pyralis]KAB0791136.1 hypothetical protein PPYR_02936 [Photinus pyralis]